MSACTQTAIFARSSLLVYRCSVVRTLPPYFICLSHPPNSNLLLVRSAHCLHSNRSLPLRSFEHYVCHSLAAVSASADQTAFHERQVTSPSHLDHCTATIDGFRPRTWACLSRLRQSESACSSWDSGRAWIQRRTAPTWHPYGRICPGTIL